MTLEDLTDRLSTLQGQMNAFARLSFEERNEDVLDLQREQLFAGKASSGEDIRPYYSEDLFASGGYFMSVESAKRYADYKARLTYPVSATRNPDAPNLYINGKFHSELGIEFTDDYMRIKGDTAFADKIIARYGESTFGLSDESMDKIMPTITESIQTKIREHING